MTTRKNADTMTVAEQNRYKNSINQLLADPMNPYGKLVAVHGDMSHDMHGMDATGEQRFLPWHRVYLKRYEEMLQQVDPQNFIPYWDWTTDNKVPAWLVAFKPTVIIPGQGTLTVVRKAKIPRKVSVAAIMALTNFTTFTNHLETGPHNHIHVSVGGPGGTMSQIPTAPADPIFWMHHAQVDRVWSQWQAANPGKNPQLSGSKAVLDPWSEKELQTRSVAALGYTYQ